MQWSKETVLGLSPVIAFTLDGNGGHTVDRIGPTLGWERWHITAIHTVCNSVKDVTLEVYRSGGSTPVAGTYSGNMDTNNTEMTLLSGDSLTFVYKDGDPLSTGTITVFGERILRGDVGYAIQ